jgi:hypothetical protein
MNEANRTRIPSTWFSFDVEIELRGFVLFPINSSCLETPGPEQSFEGNTNLKIARIIPK